MPESPGFIGKLMVFRWYKFRSGHQWGKIEQELGFAGWVAMSKGVVDSIVPGAFQPGEDICVGNFFYFGVLLVVRRVVSVDGALDFVLGPAEPTFVQVAQDYSYPRFRTCDIAGICYCD